MIVYGLKATFSARFCTFLFVAGCMFVLVAFGAQEPYAWIEWVVVAWFAVTKFVLELAYAEQNQARASRWEEYVDLLAPSPPLPPPDEQVGGLVAEMAEDFQGNTEADEGTDPAAPVPPGREVRKGGVGHNRVIHGVHVTGTATKPIITFTEPT